MNYKRFQMNKPQVKYTCMYYFTAPGYVVLLIVCVFFLFTEILGTYNDDDIYLFENKPSGEENSSDFTRIYTGHRNSATVKGVNFFGPKSEYIVSGSDCGNVLLWDKESTQVLQLQKGLSFSTY